MQGIWIGTPRSASLQKSRPFWIAGLEWHSTGWSAEWKLKWSAILHSFECTPGAGVPKWNAALSLHTPELYCALLELIKFQCFNPVIFFSELGVNPGLECKNPFHSSSCS